MVPWAQQFAWCAYRRWEHIKRKRCKSRTFVSILSYCCVTFFYSLLFVVGGSGAALILLPRSTWCGFTGTTAHMQMTILFIAVSTLKNVLKLSCIQQNGHQRSKMRQRARVRESMSSALAHMHQFIAVVVQSVGTNQLCCVTHDHAVVNQQLLLFWFGLVSTCRLLPG